MNRLEACASGFIGNICSVKGDSRFQSRMVSVGLLPGSKIEMLLNQKRRPLLLYCRNTVLALNREDGKNILVEEVSR